MKIPRVGIAFLKAELWKRKHSFNEIIGERFEDVFFGLVAKAPIYRKHYGEYEIIRFVDHVGKEYRCTCNCGEKKVFKTFDNSR